MLIDCCFVLVLGFVFGCFVCGLGFVSLFMMLYLVLLVRVKCSVVVILLNCFLVFIWSWVLCHFIYWFIWCLSYVWHLRVLIVVVLHCSLLGWVLLEWFGYLFAFACFVITLVIVVLFVFRLLGLWWIALIVWVCLGCLFDCFALEFFGFVSIYGYFVYFASLRFCWFWFGCFFCDLGGWWFIWVWMFWVCCLRCFA